jgi:hypothetical protein
MLKVVRSIVYVTAILIVIGTSYWWGRFSTWFSLNLCYSDVIGFLSSEASSVVQAQSQEKISAFQALFRSLPLHGYETECKEITDAISKYKAASSVPPPKT